MYQGKSLGLKNMLLIWYFLHLPLLSWNIFTLLFALVSDKSGNNSRKGSPTRPNKTKYKETLKQTNKNYFTLFNEETPNFLMKVFKIVSNNDLHELFSTYLTLIQKIYHDPKIYKLQTIQMKIILCCVWAKRAVLSSVKTAFKFKYET